MSDKFFTMLHPNDLAKCWPIARYALLRALPPHVQGHPKVIRAILVQVLNSRAQIWFLHNKESVSAVVITYIEKDKMSGVDSLIIYAMYNFELVPFEYWKVMSDSIDKYAKASNCNRIAAITNVPKMIEYAKQLGFTDQFSLLAKEVS